MSHLGALDGAVGWGTVLQGRRSWVRFPMVSLEFFIESFWPHNGPGVDYASNKNEYQEYFLGGKGGRCVGLTTLPPSCANCLEIWEPQPPGTLRACPGLSWDCFSIWATSNFYEPDWWHKASCILRTHNQNSLHINLVTWATCCPGFTIWVYIITYTGFSV